INKFESKKEVEVFSSNFTFNLNLEKELESWSHEKIKEFSNFVQDLMVLQKGDIIMIRVSHSGDSIPFEVAGFDGNGIIIRNDDNFHSVKTYKVLIYPLRNLINSFELIEKIKIKNSFNKSYT
ncbi:MAG: hypothetical protein WD095_00135, partial [Candidatus Paceibacterota bacterium]